MTMTDRFLVWIFSTIGLSILTNGDISIRNPSEIQSILPPINNWLFIFQWLSWSLLTVGLIAFVVINVLRVENFDFRDFRKRRLPGFGDL